MLNILKRFKPLEWLWCLCVVAFIVAQVWLDLKSPDYMAEITRLTQTPGSTVSRVWREGVYMLLCAFGSLASTVVVGFFASLIAASFSKRVRADLFSRVAEFSMEEISRFSTSSLITRSTNDITQIQMFITMGMHMMVRSPIMALWAITKIANKGFEWTAATAAAVLILVSAIAVLMAAAMPVFKKMQVLTDNLNRTARENLTGLRVVRSFNAEGYQEAKFERANAELTNAHLFTSRAISVLFPIIMTIMSALPLVIYIIGARLINNAAGMENKTAVLSDMMVFSSYAMPIIMSFMMLTMVFVMAPRAFVSAKRVNEVLDVAPKIKDGEKAEGLSGKDGEIEFVNVGFKYPGADEYILKDISFSVKKGETAAFIGSTGSGKSTLVNLVPRFFDATEGEVLVSGVNVKAYTLCALRNKIGYVPQKAALFMGTIADNVAFGDNGRPKADSAAVKKACEIAQAAEFIETMENTYEADIAQAGHNLSGGQKQRISIARAIARAPEILIFDDSFSALDYKTDRALREALKRETGHITNLIVAQRIGTVMEADKIIVLENGKIAGQGTHKELLASCAVYKEIALSQLNEEELT